MCLICRSSRWCCLERMAGWLWRVIVWLREWLWKSCAQGLEEEAQPGQRVPERVWADDAAISLPKILAFDAGFSNAQQWAALDLPPHADSSAFYRHRKHKELEPATLCVWDKEPSSAEASIPFLCAGGTPVAHVDLSKPGVHEHAVLSLNLGLDNWTLSAWLSQFPDNAGLGAAAQLQLLRGAGWQLCVV